MKTNERPSASSGLLFEADESAQLLRVRYVGHITGESVEAALPEASRALSRMRPGFWMLTDASQAESFERMFPNWKALRNVRKPFFINGLSDCFEAFSLWLLLLRVA